MLVGVLDAGFRGFARGSVRFGYCDLVWLCLLRISVACGVWVSCLGARFGVCCLVNWLRRGAVWFGCFAVAVLVCGFDCGLFTCAFRFLLLFFWGFYYFVSVVVVTSDFGVLGAMRVT